MRLPALLAVVPALALSPSVARADTPSTTPAPAAASAAPPANDVVPSLADMARTKKQADAPAAAVSLTPEPVAPARSPEADPVNDAGNDRKKNGRIFELVWANAEAGLGYVNLASVNSKNLELQHSSSSGGMFGFGAGIRVLAITLGGRARLNDLSTFSFWELDGELGIHIAIQKWDPYFGFHGGYAFVGSLSQELSSEASQISVHGANAGANLGVDYYFLPYISAGLDLTGDFLFLERPPISLPAMFKDLPPAKQKMILDSPSYKESGDSIGLGLAASLHIGLHI